MMVVALPLIVRVAGVEAEALADELGCVGEAPGVPEPDEAPAEAPDEVPDDVLDEVFDVPGEVLVPDALPAVSDAALGALVWRSTPAGEHPKSMTDKTNTPMVALVLLMGSSWSSASRVSLDGDSSLVTERSGIPTGA